MQEKPDLSGPVAFFSYGLTLLGLAAFLMVIRPVPVDHFGGLSARQELEAQGLVEGAAGEKQEGGKTAHPPREKQTSGIEPELRADAVELCRLWMKDTALFKKTYGEGRLLGASGAILELREFGGDYIIILDGAGPQYKTGTVQCYFDPDQMLPLRALRQGDAISIVGNCESGVKGPILKHSRLEGRL